MKRDFTLEYWRDEGLYIGRLREVPGVFSQGETMDDLIRNIEEVYHLMLEESVPPAMADAQTVEIGLDV